MPQTTLQQVLNNGSVLNKDNSINCSDFAFEIVNANYFRAEGVNQGTTARIEYDAYTPANPFVRLYVNNGENDIKLEVRPSGAIIVKNGVTKNLIAISVDDNYSDDSAAEAGGIQIGEGYHTNGVIKIRLV